MVLEQQLIYCSYKIWIIATTSGIIASVLTFRLIVEYINKPSFITMTSLVQ